jgi:putative ABC transport system substrate-binding protein
VSAAEPRVQPTRHRLNLLSPTGVHCHVPTESRFLRVRIHTVLHRWARGARAAACAVLLLSIFGTGYARAGYTVLVVVSKPDGSYQHMVDSLQNHLAARETSSVELIVQSLEDYRSTALQARRPQLVVTVGLDAARRVARSNPPVPILHTLVHRTVALEILREGRPTAKTTYRDSAIFIEQPLSRQLDLLRLALPNHKRVGVILGPTTQALAAELRTAARPRSLTINPITLTQRDDLLSALQKLLEENENDVLLSVAEPMIYSGETIHHVLLTTYRYKIPVIGISRAYVDAGALLAVYSTPELTGRQVADLLFANAISGNHALPAPDYAKYYLISVNQRVAASLDLKIDADALLQRKMEALPGS